MTDKRLLLVNPPFPRKVAGAPLQLLYLAAAFRDAPVEVQILDLNIADEPSRALGERLQTYGPTHVGVTSYSPNYPESLEVMRFIKNFNSGIIVISGGHHETAIGSCAKKPEFIDFRVASTFGENEFLGILGTENKIEMRETLFPAYELLEEHSSYQFDSRLFGGRKMTQILTATGCSQKCDFCSAQLAYVPFRVNTVINHLKRLVGLGYKAVFFNDPNFTNPFKDSRLFLAQNKLDVYARVKIS